MNPDQLRNTYNYYNSMYNSFANNPSAQNAVVEQMYGAFNPQKIQEQQFIQGLFGGGQQAQAPQVQYADNGYYRTDDGGIAMGSQLNQMGGAPRVAGMNTGGIDPNGTYEVDIPETSSATGDAMGTIGKSFAPGLAGATRSNFSPMGVANNLGRGLVDSALMGISGGNMNDLNNMRGWDTQSQYLRSGLGDLYGQVKSSPFLNDAIRRFGDVANTANQYKMLPGYTTN